MKILKEYKGSRELITDEKMTSLINECKKICNDAGFYIDPELKFYKEDLGWTTYGQYRWPRIKGEVGTITLNDKLWNSSDDEIKSVILHELAHYLKAQEDFRINAVYWDPYYPYHLKINRFTWEKAHHGPKWKYFANILARKTGLTIERTSDFSIENDAGETKKDKYNYYLVCDNCGKKIGYIKYSKAVQHPERYRCGTCNGTLHREDV